jgi:hypothetical protein
VGHAGESKQEDALSTHDDEVRSGAERKSEKPARFLSFLLLGVLGGIALFAVVMVWYFMMVDQPPPPLP